MQGFVRMKAREEGIHVLCDLGRRSQPWCGKMLDSRATLGRGSSKILQFMAVHPTRLLARVLAQFLGDAIWFSEHLQSLLAEKRAWNN